jgi:purine-binding chemotaxis protein CheW
MARPSEAPPTSEGARGYVTVTVGGVFFGLPIGRVHDAFRPSSVTPVPLAPPEVVGLLNLRGRVVTALCLRRRLGLPAPGDGGHGMAVGLEQGGETFGLVVDEVGEVLHPPPDTLEAVPPNLDARWRSLAVGVHRLDGRLLVVLDVDALLAFGEPSARAA